MRYRVRIIFKDSKQSFMKRYMDLYTKDKTKRSAIASAYMAVRINKDCEDIPFESATAYRQSILFNLFRYFNKD